MIAAAEQSTRLNETAFSDFLGKRSTDTEPDAGLTDALSACSSAGIEVVSLLPGWVELRVPSDLAVISPLQQLVAELEADSHPRSVERLVGQFGRCFAMLSNMAVILIRRRWLRSSSCASSTHLFVG